MICGKVAEGDRHELIVESREGVSALDVDNSLPGVPFDRVIAPELWVYALQHGEVGGAGRGEVGPGQHLESLKIAEEFVSIPAGSEGQEVTAIGLAFDVGLGGIFHVDVVDS